MIAILIIALVIWSLEQGKKTKKTTKTVAKLEKEQERQRREQERQAKQLAKHEEEIFRLNQKVNRLSAKVEDLDLRILDLERLNDIVERQFSSAIKAGDEAQEEKALRKIMTINNQLSSARDQRQRALDDIEAARRKISA